MAGPLMKLISGLPDDYRQAQFDQAKLNMLNQLKTIQLVDPATGQINPAAYGQMAQYMIASGDPRGGVEVANLGQQQQELTQAQNIARGFSGGGPGAAAGMTYTEPRSATGLNYGTTAVPMDYAKYALGKIESDNNYSSVTDSHTKLGLALGRYQIMQGELPQDLADAGLPPMTVAE